MYGTELIDQLIDRDAVRRIHVDYCHHIATKNLSAFLDLFTEDATYVFQGEAPVIGTFKGRGAISEVFEKGFAENVFWPLAAGHHITLLDDERATGTAYSQVWSGAKKPVLVSLCIYDDEYVKVAPAKWRISKRVYTALKV